MGVRKMRDERVRPKSFLPLELVLVEEPSRGRGCTRLAFCIAAGGPSLGAWRGEGHTGPWV